MIHLNIFPADHLQISKEGFKLTPEKMSQKKHRCCAPELANYSRKLSKILHRQVGECFASPSQCRIICIFASIYPISSLTNTHILFTLPYPCEPAFAHPLTSLCFSPVDADAHGITSGPFSSRAN